MSVVTFEGHCDFGLYTLKYHLFDHMVADIRVFRTPSVSYCSPYKHYNVHINQTHRRKAYGRNLRKRQTRMMETVNRIDRN